jgi:hypothetical protein
MKKLQAELIVAQTHKKDRQAQMEPLQERETKVIVQAEYAKKNMVQIQEQCTEMINKDIATQVVDALKENIV